MFFNIDAYSQPIMSLDILTLINGVLKTLIKSFFLDDILDDMVRKLVFSCATSSAWQGPEITPYSILLERFEKYCFGVIKRSGKTPLIAESKILLSKRAAWSLKTVFTNEEGTATIIIVASDRALIKSVVT